MCFIISPNQYNYNRSAYLCQPFLIVPGIKTITLDNVKKFAFHHKISKNINAKNYFIRPYIFQHKETVEKRNAAIIRFFSKNTDLKMCPKKNKRSDI